VRRPSGAGAAWRCRRDADEVVRPAAHVDQDLQRHRGAVDHRVLHLKAAPEEALQLLNFQLLQQSKIVFEFLPHQVPDLRVAWKRERGALLPFEDFAI
jgi:hypothetical protein